MPQSSEAVANSSGVVDTMYSPRPARLMSEPTIRGTTVRKRIPITAAIAPPVSLYDYSVVAATRLPLGVVYARDDELVPADAVEAWIASCAQPPRVWVADGGGGHLFHGCLDVLREAVSDLVTSLR